MRVECLSCGGTYDDVLPDGMQYFHVCPPLGRVELQAAVTAGRVTLPDGENADQAYERRSYPRPQARNENIAPRATPDEPRRIISEGRGRRTRP